MKNKTDKYAYLACPISVDNDYLSEVHNELIKKLRDANSVRRWYRGTKYTPDLIDNAIALIVILPGNKPKMNLESIPAGTRSEIRKALSHNLPIYMVYKRDMDNTIQLYKTNMTGCDTVIGLIGGTTETSIQELRTRLMKGVISVTFIDEYSRSSEPTSNKYYLLIR